jgi:hypothetical protein
MEEKLCIGVYVMRFIAADVYVHYYRLQTRIVLIRYPVYLQ